MAQKTTEQHCQNQIVENKTKKLLDGNVSFSKDTESSTLLKVKVELGKNNNFEIVKDRKTMPISLEKIK